MAITKLDIAQLLDHKLHLPIIDVRSPGEYEHAKIPGALSLPLFDNEERKIVGTAYKQQSREIAIKIGLDFFGRKMRNMVEWVETITAGNPNKEIIVHCWRGGMRSAGVAWLLDLYGFKVNTIVGGYKSYRRWVLHELEQQHKLKVLGGYTGSGKTEVLAYLQELNEPIIDLEKLANHKGSAFGALGMGPQPSQEMFENELALDLYRKKSKQQNVWIEDESQRIGLVNLPQIFWENMRSCPVTFLDVPFENRLEYITAWYGKQSKSELAAAITRIQKRLGGLETKNALNFLIEDDLKNCFSILLSYYDKQYAKSLAKRPEENKFIKTIVCTKPGSLETAKKILEEK